MTLCQGSRLQSSVLEPFTSLHTVHARMIAAPPSCFRGALLSMCELHRRGSILLMSHPEA